jgi:hypothetical protein
MRYSKTRQVNWWKTNPLIIGDGLGFVIHEKKRGSWVIARVLSKSPADRAGIKKNDRLIALDDYKASGGDLSELLLLIRRAKSMKHTLQIARPTKGHLEISIKSSPIRAILTRDQDVVGASGDCYSCGRCFNTDNGWTDCGGPGVKKRCSGGCGVA